MRKVAHLLLKNTALVGGIETFVTKAFLEGSASGASGWEYAAYCLRDDRSSRDRQRIALPSALRRCPDAVGKLLLTPWALFRARWREHAQIVHFHGFGASVWAPLARALGLEVVAHSHGIEWERARWSGPYRHLMYLIAWITCRFADRVLVVSAKEAKIYEELFGVRCHVVPGGFEGDRSPIDQARPREKVLVVAGRPVPEKRILETIEAWNSLPDHRGYVLKVFCGGKYRGSYPSRIRAAARAGRNVQLEGFVPREAFVRELASASHFVALSSLEGRSLAMLEALAMGAVLVVADTPENREFVPAEGNWFVAPDATLSVVAGLLDRLLAAPPASLELRRRNEAAGTARTWVDVRRDCEEVYATL